MRRGGGWSSAGELGLGVFAFRLIGVFLGFKAFSCISIGLFWIWGLSG